MKTQNILKLSGGAVIKLKTKILAFVKIVFTFIIAVSICYGLYYLFDYVWNGSFVDWFTKNFILQYNNTNSDTGTLTYVSAPNWIKLKTFFLFLFIFLTLIMLTIVFIVSHLHAKKKVKASVTKTGKMIYSFMDKDIDASLIFPREYSEISTQMVQIKSKMQHHEQIMKEEASRKNDLIAYLAHDLKTPLTSIIGYLTLLDEAPDMPLKQKAKYVNITLNKANRLEHLINEFFDITRFNLHQIILEKETIDFSYMLIQMADEFYPLLSAHGNTAALNVEENLTLYGDAIKLARVFNNIFKNAISYSYPKTEILISAKAADSKMYITFSNRGKTIPEQKLNSIFEKFFRLDEARTTNSGGAGLGLAIAKEIITLHDGFITAQSENEVTTFSVILPIS